MNRFVSLAARVASQVAKDPDLKTEDQFWAKVGRPDLATVPESQLLSTPLLEGLHIFQRAIQKRDGKAKKRPKPLTQFIHAGRYHWLRPTKGWRHESVTPDEALRLQNRHGVAILARSPL